MKIEAVHRCEVAFTEEGREIAELVAVHLVAIAMIFERDSAPGSADRSTAALRNAARILGGLLTEHSLLIGSPNDERLALAPLPTGKPS